jgi:hypothetical protein
MSDTPATIAAIATSFAQSETAAANCCLALSALRLAAAAWTDRRARDRRERASR